MSPCVLLLAAGQRAHGRIASGRRGALVSIIGLRAGTSALMGGRKSRRRYFDSANVIISIGGAEGSIG